MLQPVLNPVLWPLTGAFAAGGSSPAPNTYNYLVDESGDVLTDESGNLLTE